MQGTWSGEESESWQYPDRCRESESSAVLSRLLSFVFSHSRTVDTDINTQPKSIVIFRNVERESKRAIYLYGSCVLQLALSVHGLVLGEAEPYYLEAGYDRQVRSNSGDVFVLRCNISFVCVLLLHIIDRLSSMTTSISNQPPRFITRCSAARKRVHAIRVATLNAPVPPLDPLSHARLFRTLSIDSQLTFFYGVSRLNYFFLLLNSVLCSCSARSARDHNFGTCYSSTKTRIIFSSALPTSLLFSPRRQDFVFEECNNESNDNNDDDDDSGDG